MNGGIEHVDVLIVGAGPAGLAAAHELRRHGAGRVVVLEREQQPGGIPRHCGHHPFGVREFSRVLRGPDYATRLVERALHTGAEIRTATTVTALRPGGMVEIASHAGQKRISARRVLLCTGCREQSRAARLIGGTRPGGVIPTGALQGLVWLNGVRPFARPVILGSELVAFSALLTCAHAGIRPIAMIEPGNRAIARWPVPLLARLRRVPLLLGRHIHAIHGKRQVEAVELADASGNIQRIDTDGVIVTGDFVPEATLVRLGSLELDPRTGGPRVDPWFRCSDPAFFASGNLLRPVETAGWCWKEGMLAARAIMLSLDDRLPAPLPAITFQTGDHRLQYVMPQCLPAGDRNGPEPVMQEIQLRANRAVRGRLRAFSHGRLLHEAMIDTAPQRRITLPIRPLITQPPGDVELVIEEEE